MLPLAQLVTGYSNENLGYCVWAVNEDKKAQVEDLRSWMEESQSP